MKNAKENEDKIVMIQAAYRGKQVRDQLKIETDSKASNRKP